MTELLEGFSVEELTQGTELTEKKLKNVINSVGVSESDTIYGFFDFTVMGSGKEGLAITDKGIYWKSSGSTVDGKAKIKGSLSNEQLSKLTYRVEKNALNVKVVLKNSDMSSSDPFEYQIYCVTNEKDGLIKALSAILAKLTFGEGSNPERIESESGEPVSSSTKPYDQMKFEAYIAGKADLSDPDIEKLYAEDILKYQKKFSPYNVNGIEKFQLNWSWYGFLFTWIYLIHRKAYKEGGIALIAGILISLIPGIGSIIFFIVMGILSPFLLYKRYKSIEKEIESTIDDKSKKIETFQELGGTNSVTSFLTKSIATVIILVVIIAVIAGIIGIF